MERFPFDFALPLSLPLRFLGVTPGRFPERKFTVIILTNRNEAQIAEYPHRIADWCLFADP